MSAAPGGAADHRGCRRGSRLLRLRPRNRRKSPALAAKGSNAPCSQCQFDPTIDLPVAEIARAQSVEVEDDRALALARGPDRDPHFAPRTRLRHAPSARGRSKRTSAARPRVDSARVPRRARRSGRSSRARSSVAEVARRRHRRRRRIRAPNVCAPHCSVGTVTSIIWPPRLSVTTCPAGFATFMAAPNAMPSTTGW